MVSPDLRPGMGLQDHMAVLFSVLKTLFIYGCAWALLLHVGFLQCGLSPVQAFSSVGILSLWRAGLLSSCDAQASHWGGFSCCGTQAPGMWASVFAAYGLSSRISWVLDCGLSNCEAQALLPCGRWDPSRPGIESSLVSRFPTTGPPGKS